MKDPVVPLVLALYGHVDSGGYWEEKCTKAVSSLGFQKLVWEWPGLYWHPEYKALLGIYVDDFKLAAPEKHQNELWKKLRSVITMDPQTDDGRFLGCESTPFTCTVEQVKHCLLYTSPSPRDRG